MTAAESERYLRLVRHDHETLILLRDAARITKPRRDVSDWLVTLHFYVLCVYVKALGRAAGRDIQDHYSIRQWLNTDPELLAVAKPYRKVEEWSRDARYEGRVFDAAEIERFHGWFREARDRLVAVLRSKGVASAPVVEPVAP